MHIIYENWPDHFKRASTIQCKSDKDPTNYNSIFFCGMGGSAASCDILNDLVQEYGTVFSTVIRGNKLPHTVNNESLVVINSVSGNTEEMLRIAKEASDRKAETICISSGGKLKDLAAEYGQKHIGIPNLFLPRASLPYLVLPGLKLISPFLADFDNDDIFYAIDSISETSNQISANVPEDYNIAKKVAKFLKNGFVFCFTSPYLICAGTRFKNSLNENSKLHCTRESIIESTHNEIVPFTYRSNIFSRKVIFLQWKKDIDFVKVRFKKVQNFFSEIGQPCMELTSYENSLLAAILCSIYILDYSTVHLAIDNGIDPSPTPAIDILKRV